MLTLSGPHQAHTPHCRIKGLRHHRHLIDGQALNPPQWCLKGEFREMVRRAAEGGGPYGFLGKFPRNSKDGPMWSPAPTGNLFKHNSPGSRRARESPFPALAPPRALPGVLHTGAAAPVWSFLKGGVQGRTGPPSGDSPMGKGGAKPAPEGEYLEPEVKRLPRRRGNPSPGCFSPLCCFRLFCQYKRGESKSLRPVRAEPYNPPPGIGKDRYVRIIYIYSKLA